MRNRVARVYNCDTGVGASGAFWSFLLVFYYLTLVYRRRENVSSFTRACPTQWRTDDF